jgi:hypothetical protein
MPARAGAQPSARPRKGKVVGSAVGRSRVRRPVGYPGCAAKAWAHGGKREERGAHLGDVQTSNSSAELGWRGRSTGDETTGAAPGMQTWRGSVRWGAGHVVLDAASSSAQRRGRCAGGAGERRRAGPALKCASGARSLPKKPQRVMRRCGFSDKRAWVVEEDEQRTG